MNVFQIHPHDNVAVAVTPLPKAASSRQAARPLRSARISRPGIKWLCSPLPKAKTSSSTASPSGRPKWIFLSAPGSTRRMSKVNSVIYFTIPTNRKRRIALPGNVKKIRIFRHIRGQMAVPASATKSGSSRPSVVSTTLPGPLKRLRKTIKQKISMESMPIVIPTAARN